MIDPIAFDPSQHFQRSRGASFEAKVIFMLLPAARWSFIFRIKRPERFWPFLGGGFSWPFLGKKWEKPVVAAVRTRYIDRMLTHIEYVHVVVFTPYCTILITCDSHKRTCYYFAWKLLVFDHSGNDCHVLIGGSGYLVTGYTHRFITLVRGHITHL